MTDHAQRWSKESEVLSGDPGDIIAALRATITQQAQELEQAKGNYAIQKAAADDYEQQLAAMTRERDELNIAVTSGIRHRQKYVERIDSLVIELAASQARCREMEMKLPKEMPNCTILFMECPYGHGRLTATNWLDHGCDTCKLAQLQATLAAREAELDRVKHFEQLSDENYSMYAMAVGQRDAAVQDLKRLQLTWTTARPTVAGLWLWRSTPSKDAETATIRENDLSGWCVHQGYTLQIDRMGGEWAGPIPLPTEAQQASGGSGGAANQGAGA